MLLKMSLLPPRLAHTAWITPFTPSPLPYATWLTLPNPRPLLPRSLLHTVWTGTHLFKLLILQPPPITWSAPPLSELAWITPFHPLSLPCKTWVTAPPSKSACTTLHCSVCHSILPGEPPNSFTTQISPCYLKDAPSMPHNTPSSPHHTAPCHLDWPVLPHIA